MPRRMNPFVICIIIALLLCVIAYGDYIDQKNRDIEYCTNVKYKAWGAYRDDINCNEILGK